MSTDEVDIAADHKLRATLTVPEEGDGRLREALAGMPLKIVYRPRSQAER